MGKALFVLVIISVFSMPVHAWHTNTHYQMTKDAASLLPEELQKILTSH